jgi:cobalt/nickel transport system permease protein
LHHVVIDRWSRRASPLHSREPRTKLIALAVFLATVATTPGASPWAAAGYLSLLAAAVVIAHLPFRGMFARAAMVLPFSAALAVVSWLSGDPQRAVTLAAKSYLSALAVLLLVATTPLERLMRAMEGLGAPRLIVLVVQFLYRYLFVISEQAQHMRVASACRAPLKSGLLGGLRFRAAAGAAGILFARSYARAEGIHRAMLARGFEGRFPATALSNPRPGDILFLALAIALSLIVRIGAALV